MQYLLLIHQVDAPTPRDADAWATLSEEEQKQIYADYQALNQTRASRRASGWTPRRPPRPFGCRTARR
jgi:hypothetical protein